MKRPLIPVTRMGKSIDDESKTTLMVSGRSEIRNDGALVIYSTCRNCVSLVHRAIQLQIWIPPAAIYPGRSLRRRVAEQHSQGSMGRDGQKVHQCRLHRRQAPAVFEFLADNQAQFRSPPLEKLFIYSATLMTSAGLTTSASIEYVIVAVLGGRCSGTTKMRCVR